MANSENTYQNDDYPGNLFTDSRSSDEFSEILTNIWILLMLFISLIFSLIFCAFYYEDVITYVIEVGLLTFVITIVLILLSLVIMVVVVALLLSIYLTINWFVCSCYILGEHTERCLQDTSECFRSSVDIVWTYLRKFLLCLTKPCAMLHHKYIVNKHQMEEIPNDVL